MPQIGRWIPQPFLLTQFLKELYPFTDWIQWFHVQVSGFHRASQNLVTPRTPGDYRAPPRRGSNSPDGNVGYLSRVLHTDVASFTLHSRSHFDKLHSPQHID